MRSKEFKKRDFSYILRVVIITFILLPLSTFAMNDGLEKEKPRTQAQHILMVKKMDEDIAGYKSQLQRATGTIYQERCIKALRKNNI